MFGDQNPSPKFGPGLDARVAEVKHLQSNLNRQSWQLFLRAAASALRLIDLPLLGCLLALCFCGLMVLYSADTIDGQTGSEVGKQAMWLAIGFAGMLIIAQIPPEWLRRWAFPMLAISVVLLALVPFIGITVNGSQRWLDIGVARLQPAEMVKITAAIGLAAWFHMRAAPPSFSTVVGAFLLITVPVGLVLLQPDLGTSLLIFALCIFVVFFAGLPTWLVVSVTGTFALSVGLLVTMAYMDWITLDGMRVLLVDELGLLHDYQFKRIATTFDPESDPQGAGYQIIQSRIAIGSGGLFGKGWLNGDQTHLAFLPYRTTDFIFPVLAEEFGLLGALPVLGLYLFIVCRGLYIAAVAQTIFGRLLAAALSLSFFAHVFVNIGMVSGILPVVGVPLPLMSYGGTSLVTILAGFGVLMSIHKHRQRLRED